METDILDWKLPKIYYNPKGWRRKLDLFGLVFAPISMSLDCFLGAILFLLTAGSNGIKYYIVALTLFLVGIGMLIIWVPDFRKDLKSYVNHQATRDEVNRFRGISLGLIIVSFSPYFMFLAPFLLGPFIGSGL